MLTVLQHKHLRHHRASMRLSNKQANRQSVDTASVWLLTTTLKTQVLYPVFLLTLFLLLLVRVPLTL